MKAEKILNEFHEIIIKADRDGWVFHQELWRKDGFRSKTSYELYLYYLKYKKINYVINA